MSDIKEFKFICEKCNYKTNSKSLFNKHEKTKKHNKIIEPNLIELEEDNSDMKYKCKFCNYYTNNLKGYYQHKKTKKHKNNFIEEPKKTKYKCEHCNYYTNNPKGLSQHKKTKKHQNNINYAKKEYKYNCPKCDFFTNCNIKFCNHYEDNHVKDNDFKQLNQTNNYNNINSNNTINNTYNLHLNTDKETFKIMLNNMPNDKFLEMLGGVKNQLEFDEEKMWDENVISDKIIDNLVNKSIINKTENKSIENIKINNSDLKYNMIKLKEDNSDEYKNYNVNNLFGDILKNNIKMTKDEHQERMKDMDYLLKILFLNKLSNKTNFKKHYKYDYNSIINDVLTYSIESIDMIKQNQKLTESEIELLNFKLEVYKNTKKHLNEMKLQLKRLIN
jgi:hypothetical protein